MFRRELSVGHSRAAVHVTLVVVTADTDCGNPVHTKLSMEKDAGHEVPSS